MASAYYNEIDPYAAAWLRNLIAADHIAPGDVDERDIQDVHPDDLRSYTQCHFFAGIGVWSHALRAAGWSDDRPVWTGSCPCQPFSAAGKGAGFDDERHLWPHWHHLIRECRPPVVFGEQVASKDSGPWIDLVHDDMEALGHAVGAIPFPSAGVGAPHIRDRLYWMAYTERAGIRSRGRGQDARTAGGLQAAHGERERLRADACQRGPVVGLAHAEQHGGGCEAQTANYGAQETVGSADWIGRHSSALSGVANADGVGPPSDEGSQHGIPEGSNGAFGSGGDAVRPGPTHGLWRDADWLFCRDGRWRPVEPGAQPLVNGAPSRVGRLRAYGNAINAKAAQAFIECATQVIP